MRTERHKKHYVIILGFYIDFTYGRTVNKGLAISRSQPHSIKYKLYILSRWTFPERIFVCTIFIPRKGDLLKWGTFLKLILKYKILKFHTKLFLIK